MIKHSYHFEQLDTLSQFVAAFDDCFVFRYTKERVPKEKINVRYIFGPKQRVLHDITDKAKNITLPAIALEQVSLKRDPNRIQYKDQSYYKSHVTKSGQSKIPSPIPVTYDIKCGIIAYYKEDIDQIVNNIVSWMNPYMVISWRVPKEFQLDFVDELRSEVTWSGSVDYENPTNIDSLAKYQLIGNTTFTIKGWIFPPMEQNVAPIYVVRPNFHAVSTGYDLNDIRESSLSAYPTDYIAISAYPEITNIFYSNVPIFEDITISASNRNEFTLFGKRFDFNNSWYLSGNFGSNLQLEEIKTAKYPTISAYRIPDELVTTYSDNIVSISLSSNYLSAGQFTIVTANSAAWVDSYIKAVVI